MTHNVFGGTLSLTQSISHYVPTFCCSIYAARGRRNKRSYNYIHETSDGDDISFIAVDACPDPGPRRPFNFFGVLSQVMTTVIRSGFWYLD